jgi:hypothetical protein
MTRVRACSLPLPAGAGLSAPVSPMHAPTLSLSCRPHASALAARSLDHSRWTMGPACWIRPSQTTHVHNPHITVDSTPTTHTEAAATFSSCPISHSLSSLIRALAALQHPPCIARAPRELHRRPPWFWTCSAATVGSPPCPLPCWAGLSTLATQDTPQFAPSPSVFQCSRSWDSSPCSRRLPPFKPPRALSQGNQAPHAFDFPFPAPMGNCSPKQGYATARPLHRRPSPSSTFASVSCPRPCAPCHPEPSYALPSAPGPLVWPRSCLRRGFTVELGGATASSRSRHKTQARSHITQTRTRLA